MPEAATTGVPGVRDRAARTRTQWAWWATIKRLNEAKNSSRNPLFISVTSDGLDLP